MLSAKIKDLKYRKFFLKIEKKRLINKFLFIYLVNKKKVKKKQILYFFLKTNKYSKLLYKTKTKLVRRRLLTNRGRGNFRPYNLSRFMLRDFMQFGVLPGYKKAVW